ncbi:MAG: RluA family pseudouridine synthase [Clostridia bacterium]|nr:RluA family pseudouridine synthase [Clostridia bacterium]
MRILEFTVPPAYHGAKAKVFLRSYCKLSARTMIRLKQIPGGITVDGRLLRTIDPVQAGQVVLLRLPEEAHPMQQPVTLPVSVVYEDEDVTVYNKPPYMPIHPSAGHACDTLANAAAARSAARGEVALFRPINRLDRNTSGLAVTARHAHAAARLSGRVEKVYLAVTEGIPPTSGTIDAPLRPMEGHGIRREIGAGGEEAITHWRTLATCSGHALLAVVIDTGRTHQIRAHFACTGYPLAGDDMYGGHPGHIDRHALHCAAVRFIQPVTGETIVLTAPPPPDFCRLLEVLSIPVPDFSAILTYFS